MRQLFGIVDKRRCVVTTVRTLERSLSRQLAVLVLRVTLDGQRVECNVDSCPVRAIVNL